MSILTQDVSIEALPVQALQKQMQEIESKLKEGTPNISEALVLLHKNIISNEELIHILSDEDIKMIHMAHERHKGIRMLLDEEKDKKKEARKNKIDFKNMSSL